MNQTSKILCAAIHYEYGAYHPHQPRNITSGFVVAGRRHCNCIMTMAILSEDLIRNKHKKLPHVEGFVTTDNLFYDRQTACKIAAAAGQVDEDEVSGKLYSEDLY